MVHAHTVPADGLRLETPVQNNDSTDTLLESAATLLRQLWEAKRSGLVSSNSLRHSSLLLHSTLVALHLSLVGIWAKGLEHRVTFSLDNQALIPLVITVISTTFGAIYSALLVYVSQTLSMRWSVKTDQTLTATHDTAAAWTGIGSAISCLWNQRVVPASAGGVFLIFMYLGSILALHITTPALFSVETFNGTRLDQVRTQGLPAYTWPSDLSPISNGSSPLDNALDQLVDYALNSLAFFPSVVESTAETGLSGGTLYDVLNTNTAIGNVTVNATGFNITCGYVNDVTQNFSDVNGWWEMRKGSSSYLIGSTRVSIHLDEWALWYICFPSFAIDSSHYEIEGLFLNTGDASLIQKLNLFPTDSGPPRPNVTLHELENALSDISASMFWTLSHKPAGAPSSLNLSIVNGSFVRYPDSNQSMPGPFLLDGFAEVTSTFLHGRLDLSIIAVTAGLAASILLLLLSLPHSLLLGGPTSNDDDTQIDGIGLLHAIWLYRHHPELEMLLEQVEQPTTNNLRSAGEVRTRLVATREKRLSVPKDATTLLRKSREAAKRSGLVSVNSLQHSSLLLHLTLIALHFALVGIWAKGLEHRITFSLDNQALIPLVITVISTTFGVIYSALLVYVSQTLSMCRSIKVDQTLTATHDTTAAWTGIGSAISCLWNQRIVSTSLGGVLSIFIYLGSILMLHITTPALFSVETFNATRPDRVRTQGLPAYTWPSDLSPGLNGSSPLDNAFDQLSDYAQGSLVFFPPIVESPAETGLSGGTLYDVLNTNTAIGNVTVNATGFNITCGYVNDVTQNFSDVNGIAQWEMREGSSSYLIGSTPRGVISRMLNVSFTQSVVLYSTIPIVDSDNKLGASIKLSPPMNTSVAVIQLLRCSQSLVNQKAVVDSQSGHIIKVEPDIHKTVSSWAPCPGPFDGPIASGGYPLSIYSRGGNLFLDAWGLWYTGLPVIGEGMPDRNWFLLSAADDYLIQNLDLFPTDSSPPRPNVTLHELENALSDIVASMFWTLGHKPGAAPSSLTLSKVNESFVRYTDSNKTIPGPFLLDGFAEVTSNFPLGRLNLSIIAVTAGLAASILLLLLSLPNSLLCGGPTSDDNDIQIDGIGFLHAIWLYRNHPELETLLDQVEHPTTDNLRWAGEVRTRLVATRKKTSSVVSPFDADR
ncbi:hypothetical protein C8R45DRAFT_1138153 [Mycena sanguinolenta]|nr:hypothetical protein C8R45DRAFT_1138153 [Mycena sanguinolenta]